LTVVVTLMQWRPETRSPFAAKETKLYLLLYAAMIAGIPFATYRPAAFENVLLNYIVNIVFFLLFVVHVDSVPKLKRVAAILVLSIALFNVFAFTSGQFEAGRYTTASRMFDPNDVAFVEVSLLGFALWVLVGDFGIALKIMAFLTVLSGALLTLYTASRGGLLGLTTFLLLFLVLRVSRVSKGFKTVMLGALIVGAITNADKINIERYQTLGSLEEDYNFAEGGRVDIWTRGFILFLENPLTGVGVNGFAKALAEQRAAEGLFGKWVTAHNAYLQVLTETGIVGGTAFLLLIITSLLTFNRLRRTPPASMPGLGALPGILLVGFGAQLVSASFLSQGYSMFFTMAFAFSAALNLSATRPPRPEVDSGGTARIARTPEKR
jgi:O-antigen ligase